MIGLWSIGGMAVWNGGGRSSGLRGELIYTIRRDANGELHVYQHEAALDREPAVVLFEQAKGADVKHGSAS